jgi:ankyrin repeat protein
MVIGANVIVGRYFITSQSQSTTNCVQSIVSVSNYVDKLSSIFMDIGRSTPRHQAISVLYPQSTKLQSYLSEYFIVVVGLCRCLFKFGQKSVLQQFASSLNDGDLRAFQTDLNKWASSIGKEVQVNEAQESSGFRALSRSMFKSASHQQKLATKYRVLDFCSTYDHEIVWKQTRKTGNTSRFTTFAGYEEWRESSHPCALVFTGKLGSGKSVLLANIVDDLNLSTQEERPLVTYFFCRHDVPESLQARVILGSLARQLLRTVVDLDILSESCGDTYTTGDTDKILELVLQGYPPIHKTYFVVDGLDECDNDERKVVVQEIGRIQKKLNVWICASFRVEPNNDLQSVTHHLLSTQVIPLPERNPDIDAFIEADLRRCLEQELLTVGDATLIIDIQDALVAGSQGMFLWAALQIQSLCSMKTDHAILEALADLPKDLSETFARILHKSGSLDPSLQAKTLQVVLAAQRSLTTAELKEALSVVPGNANWDPSKTLNHVRSALACCGCLLIVDEEELTVRLVHHSVKQHILRGSSINEARRTLANIVVTYLGYNVFETQLSNVNACSITAGSASSRILQNTISSSTTRSLAMKLLRSRKETSFDLNKVIAEMRGSSISNQQNRFDFYEYAKAYWLEHILHVSERDKFIHQLSTKLIQNRASELHVLDRNPRKYYRLAAMSGNGSLLEYMLHFRNMDAGAIDGSIPLIWAVDCGDRDLVTLVLNMTNVDVNAVDRSGLSTTALTLAVIRKNKDILELLLRDARVDVNCKDGFGGTAITIAASSSTKDIVELILGTGKVDVNARNDRGKSAIIIAVEGQWQDTVELLLGTGEVDANAQESAIMIAARYGHRGIVQLLLRTGKVNVNAKHDEDVSAIIVAAKYGHRGIVQMLLKREDILVNAQSRDGQSALMEAALKGDTDLVTLLLGVGKADPNLQNSSGETALIVAASFGHKSAVELLLASGSDPNLETTSGRTALIGAAEQGIVKVVELLVNKNVDLNARDKHGQTALILAAMYGRVGVVELLVSNSNVEINLQNEMGETALMYAAKDGRTEVVKLLVKNKDVDLNAKDSKGMTARMLIESELKSKELDPEAEDLTGQSESWLAEQRRKYKEIVELLDRGPSPSTTSIDNFDRPT